MKNIIDDSRMGGPQAVTVALRPERFAYTAPVQDLEHLHKIIERASQVWGGANRPILPIETGGHVSDLYVPHIKGGEIDYIAGQAFESRKTVSPQIAEHPLENFRDILSVMAITDGLSPEKIQVKTTSLDPDDPWRMIYEVCLGILPMEPDAKIVANSNLIPNLSFDQFVTVTRDSISGSLEDLLQRLGEWQQHSPRELSMNRLRYGSGPNSGIRSGDQPIPRPEIDRIDAGPNIIVICSPGDIRDYALLWNLRCAHGDKYAVPIGVPVGEFSNEGLQKIHSGLNWNHNGMGLHNLYVTSASVSVGDLEKQMGSYHERSFRFVEPEALVSLGSAAAMVAKTIAVFENGQAALSPTSLFASTDIPYTVGIQSSFKLDVYADKHPLPKSHYFDVETFNERYHSGGVTRGFPADRLDTINISWPSTQWVLKNVIKRRNLHCRSSAPGIAAMTFLEALGGVSGIRFLQHAPLLKLLQEMSNRHGASWARAQGRVAGDANVTAPTAEELVDASFERFNAAFNNKGQSTRNWLNWAEERRVIVKGFPITCENCTAKQWVPVSAFAPPLICKGCARTIERPFPRELVKFTYRLGEPLRRVYEHDAMGHLLSIYYFDVLLSRSLGVIGFHPGMEFIKDGESSPVGEADCLIMSTAGECIPVESKKSFGGVTFDELKKLEILAESLGSPWTAVVINSYADSAPEDFSDLENRELPGAAYRIILTYDKILDPHPHWTLGGDPFEWSPLSGEQIAEREKQFVEWARHLDNYKSLDPLDWVLGADE